MNTAGFLANINGVGVTYRDYYRLSVPPNTELSTFNYYYDAARVFYEIGDYLLSLGTAQATVDLWYEAAAHAAIAYRDGYLTPASFQALGYWNFSAGLRMHWERTGDLTSKAAVVSLSQNAAFAQDFSNNTHIWDANNDNPLGGGSREAAYAFMSHLDAEACGAARRTRTVEITAALLHHLDQWATGLSYTYVRPFMFALTSEAVIRGVGAGLIDTTVARTKIQAVLTYIDGIYDATTKSYKYTDRIGVPPGDAWAATEDGIPAPDLNMLIAPVHAWIGGATNITRAEDLFDGGVAGAWLGSGSNQKQFNQNYRWFTSMFTWQDEWAGAAPGDPPPTSPPNGVTEVTVSRSACIPSIWTFGTKRGFDYVTPPTVPQPDPEDGPDDPAPPDPAPFDLSTYGTPVLYWDFNGETVTPLTSPTDLSANAFAISQSNATYKASLLADQVNGRQVAVFDGGDGYSPSTAIMSTITKARAGLTIYMVAKATNFTAGHQIIRANVGANARIDISTNNTTGVAHVVLRPQDAGTPYDNYGSLTYQPVAGNWNLWTFKLDFAGNKLKHWLNSDVSINDVSINSSGNSDNTNITGSSIIFLNFEAGSGGWLGQVGELGIIDGAISDATFTALKNALSLQYNTTF